MKLSSALAHNIVWVCALIGIGLVGQSTQHRTGEERPIAEGSAGDLVADHGCWTGPAPLDMAGKIPGGAIIQVRHEVAPRYVDTQRAVDRAMSKALGLSEDPNLKVIAFCR